MIINEEISKLKCRLEELDARLGRVFDGYKKEREGKDAVKQAELKAKCSAEMDAIQRSKRKINKEIRILEAKK